MSNSLLNTSKRALEIVRNQIESYRAIQSKAGLLLGTISIFLPLFTITSELDSTFLNILKTLAFILAATGSVFMIIILIHKYLKDGYSENCFNETANFSDAEYYKFEVEQALINIECNDRDLKKMNSKYNWGIFFFLSAIILITITYSINQFTTMSKKNDTKKVETITFQKGDVKKSREIQGVVRENGKNNNANKTK